MAIDRSIRNFQWDKDCKDCGSVLPEDGIHDCPVPFVDDSFFENLEAALDRAERAEPLAEVSFTGLRKVLPDLLRKHGSLRLSLATDADYPYVIVWED